MQVQFVLMDDPEAIYREDEAIALVKAFLVSTAEYYLPDPVVLVATGEGADEILNYARLGSLITAEIGILPLEKSAALQQYAREYRWDCLMPKDSATIFLTSIATDSFESKGYQEPPALLPDLLNDIAVTQEFTC